MQMIADLHTHTLCATHAYNTFTEMAAAAKAAGAVTVGLGPRILCNTHPVGIHVAFGHPRTACGFAYPLETPHQKQPRAQDDDTQGLAEALGPHKGHHPGQEDHGQHPAVCDEEGVDIGGPAQDGFLPIRRQRHEIPHGTAQQQKEGKDDPQAAHPYRDMPGLGRGDA